MRLLHGRRLQGGVRGVEGQDSSGPDGPALDQVEPLVGALGRDLGALVVDLDPGDHAVALAPDRPEVN